jgi:ubiquinol-cytochrome c reductase cytochrome b subunit
VAGYRRRRSPGLTEAGERLTEDEITIRIMNGGYNMPAFAGNLKPEELEDLVIILHSRRRTQSSAGAE